MTKRKQAAPKTKKSSATAKKPMGRPSGYKPEYARVAAKLCKLGATDPDLAEAFGVNTTTIWRWTSAHEDFCNALKVGKAHADDKVERSLFQKAVGYTYDSEKVFQFQGEVVRAQTREHVPPDTTACIFWLKNRRRDDWRDKLDHEHTGKDGEKLAPTIIQLVPVSTTNDHSASPSA